MTKNKKLSSLPGQVVVTKVVVITVGEVTVGDTGGGVGLGQPLLQVTTVVTV